MVAAQPEQLAQAAPQHKHEQSCCLEATGQSQAVGLDLLVPHEPPAGGSGPTDRLRYFNWDQRDTARAAMQTLVAALSEDPINSYFTGSSRRQRRFVKDEVGCAMWEQTDERGVAELRVCWSHGGSKVVCVQATQGIPPPH